MAPSIKSVLSTRYGPSVIKTFDALTERQQKAAWAFARKYRQEAEDVAGHLDTFFRLANGEITISEAERVTGLVIIDQTHPSLFPS